MVNVEPFKFPGVFAVKDQQRSSLATLSLSPGMSVYGEKTFTVAEEDYRLWSPRRSKLAAAIRNGLKEMPIQPGSRLLYLGAASGTTVSHCSDIVGAEGVIFAVELSSRSARGLIRLAESRSNIVPIVEDARHPLRYAPFVSGHIDVIYQDIAQPDQARILFENTKVFANVGACCMVAIKARSINSTSKVEEIYKLVISELSGLGFQILENINLEPLEKDHLFVVCQVTEDML